MAVTLAVVSFLSDYCSVTSTEFTDGCSSAKKNIAEVSYINFLRLNWTETCAKPKNV